MSTHVDGSPPSVSPDPDDGEPDRPSSGLDDGSQWVRAEIQRRMAANRSTRGRHARRGAAAVSADEAAGRETQESPRHDRAGPASTSGPQTVPQSVPLPPPGFVAAGDLPENYVPRHSVQTPGPAAEPAAPISGPIPIVRPSGDAPGEPRRGPVGGPSLPPTGVPLPVRRKRSGPGTPLQSGAGAAGRWSRPGGPVVPSEPVQRLGAPPGVLGGADPSPSWGVPVSPPRGFATAPAPADAGATVAERATGAEDAGIGNAAEEVAAVAVGSGDGRAPVDPAHGASPADPRSAEADAVGIDTPDRDTRDSDTQDADAENADAEDSEAEDTDAVDTDAVDTDAVDTDADAVDTDTDAVDIDIDNEDTDDEDTDEADLGRDDEPSAAAPATGAPATGAPATVAPATVASATGAAGLDAAAAGTDLADATTAVLPVIDGTVPPPARLVGISVQRPSANTRTVAPRPVTPRNIPVVGTAPPEPGSTRVRVVLSERKGVARPVRTIKEVQEGTAVGELLRRNLIRSQLMVTLRFGGLALLVLGTLPAILTLLPAVGRFDVLGLRVPWLLLGVLMYPFLVGVAWRYTRVADRVEQSFADHVQD